MIIVKRFALFLVLFLISFLISFWGFKNNFPGKLLSRLAQLHLTKQTGITFEIIDLELGWQKISSPKISIHLPQWLSGKTERRYPYVQSPLTTKIAGKVHKMILR